MAAYVYLIEQVGSGFVKIGISGAPEKRLAELQVGNPNLLRLRAQVKCDRSTAVRLESNLHYKYRAAHTSGEWFLVKAEDVMRDLEASHVVMPVNGPQRPPATKHVTVARKRTGDAWLYQMLLSLVMAILVWVIVYGGATGKIAMSTTELGIYVVILVASVLNAILLTGAAFYRQWSGLA